MLRAIEQKIEEIAIRLDAYERMKAAEQALIDLEKRIEASCLPIPATMTMTALP